MNVGSRHLHLRKKQPGLEPYPHPNKWMKYSDRLVYAAGIMTPLMTVPQILKIWVDKDAAGVSVFSWSFYLIGASCWVVYGILHKEKPIIFTNGAMIVVNVLVVIGVLLYG